MVATRRGVVEILRGTRVAFGRLRLDWLRLPRRADPLWLALHQLTIRHCRYLRISQGQFLLLQGMVGIRAGVAPISALELGAAQWRADFRVGALESRFRGNISQWQKPGLEEGRATNAPGVESSVRTGDAGSSRHERRENRAHRKTRDHQRAGVDSADARPKRDQRGQ